jgi:hypothetical protein
MFGAAAGTDAGDAVDFVLVYSATGSAAADTLLRLQTHRAGDSDDRYDKATSIMVATVATTSV